MRTFIAIALPDNIKKVLSTLQEELKKSGADVKWVEVHNIHLTLKFLGEIDEKKLQKIEQIIEEIAKTEDSFLIRISSLGTFPKISFPRVIWVGIDKGDKETKEITQGLEEKIAKIGIPKEKRPFSSHITIGRIRSFLNKDRLVQDLNRLSVNLAEKNLEFTAECVTLFKSTLTPRGPIYEVLKEAKFKTT